MSPACVSCVMSRISSNVSLCLGPSQHAPAYFSSNHVGEKVLRRQSYLMKSGGAESHLADPWLLAHAVVGHINLRISYMYVRIKGSLTSLLLVEDGAQRQV